ncbi:MAG: tRNA epoxyqueuosine(34) reductase QueG [Bdellovibrionales bacterium]|nr:tRNA epoxyqueuosine(34) reductase QueG [Bdellovibrionales bacterium]
MEYLEKHRDLKADPQLLMRKAKTALVIAYSYVPHPYPSLPTKELRISKYAKGSDYHRWVKADLERIRGFLVEQFPGEEFLCFTDSGPVLERDLASRAGLGWVGKNACVIDQKRGSFFFIGEIYTSLALGAEVAPPPDRCGTCTRCMDACPTQALVQPRVLDSNKCISYLTIENKLDPPEVLRPHMKDWFYGCDICQDVCPWNQKVFKENLLPTPPEPSTSASENLALQDEIKWILTASGKSIEHHFKETSILRARSWMLRRNAMIIAVNLRIKSAVPWIERWRDNARLGPISRWAVAQLLTFD